MGWAKVYTQQVATKDHALFCQLQGQSIKNQTHSEYTIKLKLFGYLHSSKAAVINTKKY